MELDWKQQRIVWNQEGKCAREACRASLKNRRNWIFTHKDSGLLYCVCCARLINRSTGMDLVIQTVKEEANV